MKVGKKRCPGPLSLDVTYLWRGQACNSERKCNKNSCPPICLHLCDQKQQSVIIAQIPQYLVDTALNCHIWELVHPSSCKMCASCSRNRCTVAYNRPGIGDRQLHVLRVEIDQSEPNLPSKFFCISFKPSSESRVLHSYVRQILPGQLLSWQRILGERVLMFHVLPSSAESSHWVYRLLCSVHLERLVAYNQSRFIFLMDSLVSVSVRCLGLTASQMSVF